MTLTVCPGDTGPVEYITGQGGLASAITVIVLNLSHRGPKASITLSVTIKMADQEAGAELYTSSSKKGVMRELRENPYVLGLASVGRSLFHVLFLHSCTDLLMTSQSSHPWAGSSLAMTRAWFRESLPWSPSPRNFPVSTRIPRLRAGLPRLCFWPRGSGPS